MTDVTAGESTTRRVIGRAEPPLLAKVDREVLWEFRRVLRREGYADKTVTSYLGMARRAAIYLEAHGRTIRTATEVDVVAFFDLGLPPRRPTRRMARKALVALYDALGRGERRNPARALPVLPTPRRKPRPLTRDDYTRFVTAAGQLGGIYEAVGVLFATTGARFSELRTLRWAQVRLTAEPAIEVTGKGSGRRGPSTREIPLHPLAVDALRRWRLDVPAPVANVFPTLARSGDGYLSERGLRLVFAEIVGHAGIEEHVTPHRLRHSVATFAADATRDLRAVQELLGHGSLATTQQYVGLVDGRVREAVDSLPIE